MCDEDDTLFRYEFGDLEAAELADFERRLRDEPELAERLEAFRQCLAAKESASVEDEAAPAVEMPRNLADRTTSHVLTVSPDDNERCVGRKRFSLTETAVVGTCALVVGMLVLPAIQSSREASRRLVCEQGLHDVYTGLALYRDRHGGYYPTIRPDENAGIFAVSLADGGYMDRHRLQKALLCPSSELASQVARNRAAVVVPTRAELRVTDALVLDRLIRFMAGSYAYRFGHYEGDSYTAPPSRLDCRAALLADAPQRGPDGAVVSSNHGECGQNVLFEDGHVSFVCGCWSPAQDRDHLFLNDEGKVAAGSRPHDVVLAPSEATPGPTRTVRVRVFRVP